MATMFTRNPILLTFAKRLQRKNHLQIEEKPSFSDVQLDQLHLRLLAGAEQPPIGLRCNALQITLWSTVILYDSNIKF